MSASPASASPRTARADSPDHTLCLHDKIVSSRVVLLLEPAVPPLYGSYLQECVLRRPFQSQAGGLLSLRLLLCLQRAGQLQVIELGDLLDLEAALLYSWLVHLRSHFLLRLGPRLHQLRLQVPPSQPLLSHHWIRVLLLWTVRLQLLKLELPEHVLERTGVKQLLPFLQHLGDIEELDALPTNVFHGLRASVLEVGDALLLPPLCCILALAVCVILGSLLLSFALKVVERAVLLAAQFPDDGASDVVDLLDTLLVAPVLVNPGEDYLLLNPAIQHYNY